MDAGAGCVNALEEGANGLPKSNQSLILDPTHAISESLLASPFQGPLHQGRLVLGRLRV